MKRVLYCFLDYLNTRYQLRSVCSVEREEDYEWKPQNSHWVWGYTYRIFWRVV